MISKKNDAMLIKAAIVSPRKISSLEEENSKLLKALNSKDPDARRLSPINPQTQPFHVDVTICQGWLWSVSSLSSLAT